MRKHINENYLERIPIPNPLIYWSKDDNERVTLEVENTGFFNRLCQRLFKKPPITYIHLDDMGSFIWPLLDGKKDIIALGKDVKNHFGENAEPLYERLSRFFQILESYKFISF